ncbi:hypothetical protein SLEP1_g4694 [Rubroshorea leprosula]|uniref:Uncharacterized protein n=1 Tax=Rubroshorea leprosula TaxID=152421 RepID=A0AAV5HPZ3_9ROSI|nr:hypothetical protein SLEP1_g4694 [Rubroshorea leprosula]
MKPKAQITMFTVVLGVSIVLNFFSFGRLYLNSDDDPDLTWTEDAAEEAEAVASIKCSGHGMAFLDGLVSVEGKPVCECHACYTGPDCAGVIQGCFIEADSGDPMFLEPFWMQHASGSTIVLAPWHRMSYDLGDGSLISKELETRIHKLHEITKNANTDGKYIVFGAGSTQLLNAAVHALSVDNDPAASRVVASTPHYPGADRILDSDNYDFNGDTYTHKNDIGNFIEFVTSPDNPDGQLRKGILEGSNVKRIHDFAYYWPHYTAIPYPTDEDLMLFTLSTLTGHGGSRFGWAIVKDKAVYEDMLKYMSLSTYGVSKETQLRALKLLDVVIATAGREMFDFGYSTMKERWGKFSKVLSMSKRISCQQFDPLRFCNYFQELKGPTPPFVWLKCEREEDVDCNAVLKLVNMIDWP